jgi:hypothetical protein
MIARLGLCLFVALSTILAGTLTPPAAGHTGQGRAVGQVAGARPAARCGDVLIIGVRGSDQKATDYGGWGREVSAVRGGIIQSARGLVIDELPLDYPAASTGLLAPTKPQLAAFVAGGPVGHAVALQRWASTRLGKYLESISVGVTRLQAAITRAVSRCPNRKVVLSGYSQGAMVVHRALSAIDGAGESTILRRIAGVALLADGDRAPNSAQHDVGSAAAGAKGVAVFGHASRRDIPRTVAGRTYSYCTDNDIVCDATLLNLVKFDRGIRIHTTYSKAVLLRLGELVAERLAVPEYGTVTGRVDFIHPTWGPSTLLTSLRPAWEGQISGEGFIRVVDATGRVRWASRTGAPGTGGVPWYEMALNDPAMDATGQIFVNWNPGRYNGVTVLQPVQGGMNDHATLAENGNYLGRFYYASIVDVEDDGTFEIADHHNDCVPSCAGGTVTTEFWRWNGTDYALSD